MAKDYNVVKVYHSVFVDQLEEQNNERCLTGEESIVTVLTEESIKEALVKMGRIGFGKADEIKVEDHIQSKDKVSQNIIVHYFG